MRTSAGRRLAARMASLWGEGRAVSEAWAPSLCGAELMGAMWGSLLLLLEPGWVWGGGSFCIIFIRSPTERLCIFEKFAQEETLQQRVSGPGLSQKDPRERAHHVRVCSLWSITTQMVLPPSPRGLVLPGSPIRPGRGRSRPSWAESVL